MICRLRLSIRYVRSKEGHIEGNLVYTLDFILLSKVQKGVMSGQKQDYAKLKGILVNALV